MNTVADTPLAEWLAPVAEDQLRIELDAPTLCCVTEAVARKFICGDPEEHPAVVEGLFSCGCVRAYCQPTWNYLIMGMNRGASVSCDEIHGGLFVTLVSWRELKW